MKGHSAEAFEAASLYLVDIAGKIGGEDWGRPGLGEWSILELLAHANRSHTLVSDYLEHPRPPEPPDSPYFEPSAIAERARAAVKDLGDDPVAVVEQASHDVIALVDQTSADATIGSPTGAMTLAQYLPSRVAELTIHGDDLARALGMELEPPGNALDETLTFLHLLATRRSRALEAVRVLTDRGGASGGFTVY